MTVEHVEFLIVGAGPTGIGAAYRAQQLGLDWRMVEAGAIPGGAAASLRDDAGFTWDQGGHVLHSHFESFDKALYESGVDMVYPQRNGWVQTQGQFVPTPIQQQLRELPTDLRPDDSAVNLAEYYRNQFGSQLAADFFIPFQEKMWATSCADIDHDWTSLRNGSSERNVPQLQLAGQSAPSAPEKFPYPRGGTGAIWDAILAVIDPALHRTLMNLRITAIDAGGHVATVDNSGQIGYRHLVSTMPLPALIDMVGGSEETLSVRALRANQVYLIGAGFVGEPPAFLADKSWVYNPDPEVWWQRATMLSNYSPDNAGPGRWNILFEIGHSADFKPLDRQAALATVDASLRDFGVDMSTRATTWTREIPYGYPVPTLGRDSVLRALDEYLLGYDIRSRGRFGGWRYESCNSDYSFQQGYEAVDAAVFGHEERALWRPELFS